MKLILHFIQSFAEPKKGFLLKCVLLFLIALLIGRKAIYTIEPYITGDGFEYVIMTEAFYQHGSPDIRVTDLENFKKDWIKVNPWDKNEKSSLIDNAIKCINETPENKFMSSCYSGCFKAYNNNVYSYHFFFYSIVNVPARAIMHFTESNPLKCFYLTNALLILLTCSLLLFYKPFPPLLSILLTVSFVFSAAFWYIGWMHPELYTMCLVTASLWLAYRNTNYWAIFLATLAALQNQPLALLVALLSLHAFVKDKFSLSTILKITVSSIWILWPPLFYYLNFKSTNLINKLGFLSTEHISFTRVWGFFFDLNQGALLAIPIAIFIFLWLWARNLINTFTKKIPFEVILLLPIILIGITLVVATMENWNHGHAVINRYATWTASIILIQTFIWLNESNFSVKKTYAIAALICVTQFTVISYFEKGNRYDWGAGVNKKYVDWIYSNYPKLYNPDPTIFIGRTRGSSLKAKNKEPIIYYTTDKKITKIIVNKENLISLSEIGFSDAAIKNYQEELNFIENWGYINDVRAKIDPIKEQAYLQREEEIRIQEIIFQIKGSDIWYKNIKQKAIESNRTIDDVMRAEAIYCLGLPHIY